MWNLSRCCLCRPCLPPCPPAGDTRTQCSHQGCRRRTPGHYKLEVFQICFSVTFSPLCWSQRWGPEEESVSCQHPDTENLLTWGKDKYKASLIYQCLPDQWDIFVFHNAKVIDVIFVMEYKYFCALWSQAGATVGHRVSQGNVVGFLLVRAVPLLPDIWSALDCFEVPDLPQGNCYDPLNKFSNIKPYSNI